MTAIPEMLSYWQHELGLDAWTIIVRTVRAWDMPIADALGTCRRVPAKLWAVVYLLDEGDAGPDDRPFDVEKTLVHELLHCYHHSGEPGSAVDLLEEQGVEMTARALVRLRREAKP